MINRSNYEFWFAEWLDNRLSTGQVIELNSFLDSNPDLRREFEAVSSIRLEQDTSIHLSKGKLKKSVDEIPSSQFDLLCAAYCEDDLNGAQLSEFLEMLEKDSSRKRTLDIIRKSRLLPPEVHYPGKTRIKHYAAGEKNRIYQAVSGAAAIIALVVITALFMQKPMAPTISGNITDTIYIIRNLPGIIANSESTIQEEVQSSVSINTDTGSKQPLQASASVITRPGIEIAKPDIAAVGHLHYNPELTHLPVSLASTNLTLFNTDTEDYRSRFGRFVAMAFREKVLDRDDFDDTPLKGYELAEAGISGLNKLLGWEMALTAKNDENGEIRSYSFSSKTIKFSTPVKKNETVE